MLRFLMILFLLSLSGVAAADIPSNRPETCTMERVARGDTCEVCSGAYHADTDYCVRNYEGRDFERRCRTSGASTWNEIWCERAAEAEVAAGDGEAGSHGAQSNEAATDTRSKRSRNCSVGGSSGAVAGMALAALMLLHRRRHSL